MLEKVQINDRKMKTIMPSVLLTSADKMNSIHVTILVHALATNCPTVTIRPIELLPKL